MSKVRNNYNIRKSYGTIIRSTTRNESERNHNDNDNDNDDDEKEKDITTIYQDQVDADVDVDFDVDDYNDFDTSIVNANYLSLIHI